jgi:superkiller protein 3
MNTAKHFFIPAGKRSLIVLLGLILVASTLFVNAQDSPEETSQAAVQLFNEGQDAHEKGDLKTAIELYSKALNILPEFPEALLQIGNARLSLGEVDDAERSFRKALELRPEWTLALSRLGSVLVSKENFAEARPILRKSIELDDQNFPALSAYAELLIKTKAPPDELRVLLGRVALLTTKANPTADIWAARGSLENALEDRKAAKASFQRAKQLDPNNKSAVVGSFETALAEGDVESAKEMASLFKSLGGDSDMAKLMDARVAASNGQIGEATTILASIKTQSVAVRDFQKAISISQSTDVAELSKQLESEPKNVQVLSKLCVLQRVSDPAAALDLCRRASELEPQNIQHAVGYGAALVQAKRFDEAARLMQELLKFAPDNVTVHANLATALFELKRFAEAKPEFQWLADKQPDRPIPYYFLAITHDQLQEYLDAMANYQKFLKLSDPREQKLEIDKVNLRLPALAKLIKDKKGKRE